MNAKLFLKLGGIVLVLVAILGFVGVLGPTADKSIFGANWWFDNVENWAHLVLGVVALLAYWLVPASVQKPLVVVVGVVALLFGLYSLFVGTTAFGANLENPADTILHLVVGVWALLSARGSMMSQT